MTKKKLLVYGVFFLYMAEVLLMVPLIDQYWSAWTKVQVGSKYSLDEIEEGQAVMIAWSIYVDYVVVDKYGRWKQIDSGNDNFYEWCREREHLTELEYADEILKEEEFPFQPDGRTVGRKLLEWAINMESFEMEKEYPNANTSSAGVMPDWRYKVVIGSGKDREVLLIGSDGEMVSSIQDIRVMLIRSKLEQLERKARERINRED